MSYGFHIQRSPEITADEWTAAVGATENVQIDASDFVAINPTTGAEIRMAGGPYNAAVWFPESSNWIKIFRYRRGRVSFNGPNDWENKESPIRITAFKLAAQLNAQIVGDEGEQYRQ